MKMQKLATVAALIALAATCHSGSAFAGKQFYVANDPCDLPNIIPAQGDKSHHVSILVLSKPFGYAIDKRDPIQFIDGSGKPIQADPTVIDKVTVERDAKYGYTLIRLYDLNQTAANYQYILNYKKGNTDLVCPTEAKSPLQPFASPANINNPG
jgi:hypothetical protein